MITLGLPACAPSIAARIGAILFFASSALPLTSNWTRAECRSREMSPAFGMVDRRDDVGRRSAAARASARRRRLPPRTPGSSTVDVARLHQHALARRDVEVALVEDLLGAPRVAVRDRPALHLLGADEAADGDGERRRSAIHPKAAVFQCAALQRPARPARFMRSASLGRARRVSRRRLAESNDRDQRRQHETAVCWPVTLRAGRHRDHPA